MTTKNNKVIAFNDAVSYLIESVPNLYEQVSFYMSHRHSFDIESDVSIKIGILQIPIDSSIILFFKELDDVGYESLEFSYSREATKQETSIYDSAVSSSLMTDDFYKTQNKAI